MISDGSYRDKFTEELELLDAQHRNRGNAALRAVEKIRRYCEGNEKVCCHITEHTIQVLKDEGFWTTA